MTFLLNVFAQEKNIEQLKQKIEETPYVIEGKILNVEIFAGDKEGNRIPNENAIWEGGENGEGYFKLKDGSDAIGYSKATIEICKAYKGNVSNQTIEIITQSSSLQVYLRKYKGKDTLMYHYWRPSHGSDELFLPRNKNAQQIFFLKMNNTESYSPMNIGHIGIISTEEQLLIQNNYYAGGTGLFSDIEKLKTKKELNNFLSQFPSLNINAPNYCNPTPEKKNVGSDEFLEEEKIEIDYQQQLNNYNNWLNKTQKRLKENIKQNTKSSKKAEGLILEIDNPRLSGPNSTQMFLEFDIMAYGTSNSTYFDNCLIRIMYNTSAFGSNLVANGNVTITIAPAFSPTTYLDPQAYVIDQTSNTLGIPFGVDTGLTTINRTALTIFPIKMLTVKIKIQNCSILSNINFTDVTFTDFFSFYTLTANAPITPAISYNTTQYNGSITDKTCEPIITNFSNNIPAGIGAIFTVNGRYFGDSKNTGTVIFKNANKGNTYPTPSSQILGEGIESYDVISWSDKEIKIKLPAVIDSITSDVQDPHYQPTPGSGKFKVKNKYGYYKESTTELTIPYAVYQAIDVDNNFQFTKVTPELSGQDINNGYTVHLHPNVVAAYPNVREVVKKALKDWSCVSGINWKLGNDTAITHFNDGINMIYLDNLTSLQQTKYNFKKCINTNPWEYYLEDFDIAINQSTNWQVDTSGNIAPGKYDFYHAIAHELGHGHLLMHANDSINGIMFWGAGFGPILSNQRKHVWSSPATTGAQYVTANLINGISGCVGQHILSLPTNCSAISVEEYDNADLNINHYPNPVRNGELTVEFVLKNSTDIYFFLYDNTGKLIKHNSLAKTKVVSYSVSVDNLSEGVYYLQIIADSQRQTVKFIKQ